MLQTIKEKSAFAFRRYIASMLFLHLITFALHLAELFVSISHGKNTFNVKVLLQLFFNDSSFIVTYSTYVLAFYFLIYYLSDFTARMLLAALLVITISIQIGLMQYFLISNMLLGADLWNYSLHDIKMTVSASTSISWWQLILFPIVVGGAMRLHYSFQQNTFSLPIAAAVLLVYVVLWFANGKHGIVNVTDVNDKNLAINKSQYFITKTAEFMQGNQVNSPYMQLELLASAGAYPFEHKQPELDELGPYFKKVSSTPPNVVFVLVEGLGKTFVGQNAEYQGCMPFLDSLSTQSLFWTNFLSTAGRTFGVLPSVLGSLPYGKGGFMEETNMPNHTSLVQLLKQNGYHTGFYYGGDANFDGQRNFLNRQNIDSIIDMAKFDSRYQKIPENNEGFSWGYPDEELYRRSFSALPINKPYFSTYLTVTTHEPFVISNPQRYDTRLKKFIQLTNNNQQVIENKEAFRTLMNADDALRYLIETYKNRPEYANTIFVITGDHRMIPVNHKNEIDRYHVPLIIYSPLLKTNRVFKSVCSHTDLPSTFTAFLKKQYKLNMPEKVHWLGNGLTFGTTFSSDKHLPIMRNKGQIADYVFGKYFITDGALQNLSDNMEQTQNRDEELTKKALGYLEQFKQLNSYVCKNDKLYSLTFKTTAPNYAQNTVADEDVDTTTPVVETPIQPNTAQKPIVENNRTSTKAMPASNPENTLVTKPGKRASNIAVNNELRAAQDFVLLNPSNAQGYYELGVQHVKLGNLGWAKANFERALALNYKLKDAYIALIELSLARNNKEAARAYYYKAIGVYSKEEFEDQLQLIKSK